jgi:hypothetical protein
MGGVHRRLDRVESGIVSMPLRLEAPAMMLGDQKDLGAGGGG